MTGASDQSSVQILEALAEVRRRGIAGFGDPGHDEGRLGDAGGVPTLRVVR